MNSNPHSINAQASDMPSPSKRMNMNDKLRENEIKLGFFPKNRDAGVSC